ncbi:MAG: hypothetical protein V8S88_10545 [Lachnospiraceae bacterium]
MTFWKSPVIMTVLSLEHRFIGQRRWRITSFMDRVFYADLNGNGDRFRLKPAAVVSSARRSERHNLGSAHYFGLMQMPIVTSRYWNMVHGMTPEEVKKDLEGMQVMRVLGRLRSYHLSYSLMISLPEVLFTFFQDDTMNKSFFFVFSVFCCF